MKSLILAVFTFLTLLVHAQLEILNSDFQLGIPSNYSIVSNDGNTPDSSVLNFSNAWVSIQDPNDSLNYVAGSTSFFSPIGTASRWLITPKLTLGSYGNMIKWNAKSHDASFPDDYMVLISNTDSLISSFSDTIGWVVEESFEWNERSVDLSLAGYNNENVFIAFVNITNDGFKLYLDNIHAFKENPAGIIEKKNVQLNVYPNPTTDFLTINSKLSDDIIKLMTLNGQLIDIPIQENKLDLRKMQPGVYLLTVENQKGKAVKRIIKN